MPSLLVATDFSPTADLALQEAVDVAGRLGGTVHLVHVIDDVPLDASWLALPVPSESISHYLTEEATRALAERAERHPGIRTEIRYGLPDRTIAAVADDLGIDLLVAGQTGTSFLERVLLGSTAERLLRSAARNTLLVHPNRNGLRRIVAPVDLSDCSAAALRMAIDLAAAADSELRILHVYPYAGMVQIAAATAIAGATILETEIAHQASQRLGAFLEGIDFRGLEPIIDLRAGMPAPEILAYADACGATTICLGFVGRTGLGRLLVGNTAERVVRGAPCSLLAIRHD